MLEDNRKKRTMDEQATFVMSFVDHSAKEREEFEAIWDEVEQNFLVRTHYDTKAHRTDNPLDQASKVRTGSAVLKDPESHQEMMTIAAKIVLALYQESGYIKAIPVGMEDALKANVASALLEYVDQLPGHFITDVMWVVNTMIHGTGVVESSWGYHEQPRNFRSVEFNPFTGDEISSVQTLIVPVYDDVERSCIDIRDFYGDPSEMILPRMKGIAVRFRMTAKDAEKMADAGLWNKKAVKQAKESHGSGSDTREEEDIRSDDNTEINHKREAFYEFEKITGYRYYGFVPFATKDGIDRREIIVWGGETVRSEAWPRDFPVFDMKIIPRPNSFYGLGPGEIVRHDQDFADTLKMMLADAVVKMTHPPFVYNQNADVGLAQLRAFNPRVPIRANSTDAIQQLGYAPPVQATFAMYSGVKDQMREGSGALGAVQGVGLGTNRKSATEAAGTFRQAMDRPEMFAMVVEREYLPRRAKYELELYKEFLETTSDLRDRVGVSNSKASLADILLDFDIKYVGTRQAGSKAEKLASFREITQIGATNPIAQQVIPWIPLFQKHFEELGAHELAAMVGNPQLIQLHMLLQQYAQPQPAAGNGNGNIAQGGPAGLPTAQALGGEQF